MGHARMIDDCLDGLSPAGARAARNALLELALGVLTQQVDGNEPQLAPALVQAARTSYAAGCRTRNCHPGCWPAN
ncbi:hypothetical protein [Streptomyces sp. NPDC087856]|uniref:hypothetical protein n=1 Tax=Streptomyces sp. NPDC087856 TaxID=3365811 RepID=UPI0038070DA6